MKQKSIKNDHTIADVLFFGALAITLAGIAMIGVGHEKIDIVAAYAVILANIFLWSSAIYFKIIANHKELKALIEGKL